MFTGTLSVRVRLTLWNVAVVALTLAFFGIVLRYSVERVLVGSLDRDLQRRAQPFAEMMAHPRRPLDENGPPPEFRAGPPLPEGSEGPPHQERQPPFFGGANEQGGQFPGPRGEGGGGGRNGGRRPRDPARRDPFPARVLDSDGAMLMPDGERLPNRPWSPAGFDAALRSKVPNFRREVETDSEPLRIFSLPVKGEEGRVAAVIQTAAPTGEMERAVRSLTMTLLALLPVALLLASLGGMWLTERALRPIRDITGAAAQISDLSLTERLPVQSRDEFGQLTGVLNGMLERLEDAFARQRRFTADASHELRTPLAVIKAHSSLALEDAEGENRETLLAIDEATDRANRIVRDLLLLARAESGGGSGGEAAAAAAAAVLPVQKTRLEIGEVFHTARQSVLTAARTGDGSALPIIEDRSDGVLYLVSDRDLLVRLLVNLLENALRYTPPQGSITFEAKPRGAVVILTVSDTGEGIAPEHLPRLTEPFYRADAARSRKSGGAGLGLAICHAIVRALGGGTLHIESAVGKGTVVTVSLPAAAGITGSAGETPFDTR